MLNEPAPELAPGLEWINAPPTTLGAMRGYITIIAFWSAGSAYCQNMMEDLSQLQKKYAGALQVVAVHTPKFDAEHSAHLVRKTCNRLAVGVRVVHDPGFVAWQHYGITAWPTAVVVDPNGILREFVVGDRQREKIERLVAGLVEQHSLQVYEGQAHGLRGNESETPLLFPSGICLNERVLFIADTGHHQIVECTHEGRQLRRFGSHMADFMDGMGSQGAFRRPTGIAVGRDALFVCDTGNHALRRVRLIDGDVQTLAGNGRAGQPMDGTTNVGRSVLLNQPWSVAVAEDRLYLGLAGCNQIWSFDRMHSRLNLVAGSGSLALVDGDGRESALAQPAGISLVHALLYVADSGASALRSVQTASAKVQTLVGQGLFEFGDAVGARAEARLQYPTAVAKDPDTAYVWILDSYNNAVRKLKLGGGEVAKFEIQHPLDCPLAMAATSGALWIANTNAHEVLRVDTSNGTVRRLPVGE